MRSHLPQSRLTWSLTFRRTERSNRGRIPTRIHPCRLRERRKGVRWPQTRPSEFTLHLWRFVRPGASRNDGRSLSRVVLQLPLPCPLFDVFFFSPDVHYGATTAFNNSDMFTDVPSAFFSQPSVVAVIVVATVRLLIVINPLTLYIMHIVWCTVI